MKAIMVNNKTPNQATENEELTRPQLVMGLLWWSVKLLAVCGLTGIVMGLLTLGVLYSSVLGEKVASEFAMLVGWFFMAACFSMSLMAIELFLVNTMINMEAERLAKLEGSSKGNSLAVNGAHEIINTFFTRLIGSMAAGFFVAALYALIVQAAHIIAHGQSIRHVSSDHVLLLSLTFAVAMISSFVSKFVWTAFTQYRQRNRKDNQPIKSSRQSD